MPPNIFLYWQFETHDKTDFYSQFIQFLDGIILMTPLYAKRIIKIHSFSGHM
jgi:hypothetical protein